MTTNLTAHVVEEDEGADDALLKVRCDRVRLPDGAEATREYIRHPGGSRVGTSA